MNLIIYNIIIIIILFINCNVEKNSYKKIKKVIVKFYKNYNVNDQGDKIKFNEEISKNSLENISYIKVHYNKHNQILKDEEFNKIGDRIRYSKYSYKNGYKFKEEIFTDNLQLNIKKYFNIKNQLIKEIFYKENNINRQINYIYNNKNKIVKEEYLNDNEILIFYKSYNYNKNKIITIKTYTANGKLIFSLNDLKKINIKK